MSKNKIIISFLIIATLSVTVTGCYKTTTLLENNSPVITTTVSLSKDLQPIFTSHCALSGCHNGSISPNLSSGNAYNSLSNGGFINTGTPANSVVYLWLSGKESATMPLGAAPNPGNIEGYILAWITQGAHNN
jgi:hypothetical protein